MRTALFIGGTGTISAAIVRRLEESGDWEIWLLNRGNRKLGFGERVHSIQADMGDEADVREKLRDLSFDCVCEFIGFTKEQAERDIRQRVPFSQRALRLPIPTGSTPGIRSPVRRF